jgi:hypothetical protein
MTTKKLVLRKEAKQNKRKYLLKDKSVDDAFCGKTRKKKL